MATAIALFALIPLLLVLLSLAWVYAPQRRSRLEALMGGAGDASGALGT